VCVCTGNMLEVWSGGHTYNGCWLTLLIFPHTLSNYISAYQEVTKKAAVGLSDTCPGPARCMHFAKQNNCTLLLERGRWRKEVNSCTIVWGRFKSDLEFSLFLMNNNGDQCHLTRSFHGMGQKCTCRGRGGYLKKTTQCETGKMIYWNTTIKIPRQI
jgi:hypothetical protein